MSSPVDEIKSRLDIAELIQSYVRLQKAGINYRANCPFHSEKTPSFFVSPTRQIWHCFGCGKGGDHFKFVMEIEGQDFPEALRVLAQRAGVVLKREDPTIRSERNRLYDLCEEATKIFEKSLSLTPAAKSYLKKRGLKDETVTEFRIGFAPQSWDFLLKALAQKGFKKEEVEKAGLAVKSEDGSSHYDRFRSRIMFPLTDANGRIVGFSGRIFEAISDSLRSSESGAGKRPATNEAKYVNTPQTIIYDKSRVLYGFDKAKNEIRTQNKAVIVEGQMDCVMSHQAGVKNVIAVSGTALTVQQLKTLRRLCDTLVCSFDTDAAGESATKRSLALSAEFEFTRKISVIPSGKDPADTILESPEAWFKAVSEAKPVVEFYFEKAKKSYDHKNIDGKKATAALLMPFIAELANEIERSHWVTELAKLIDTKEDAVLKELKRTGRTGEVFPSVSRAGKEEVAPQTRRELLEERLLSLLTVIDEEVKKDAFSPARHIAFASSSNQKLFDSLSMGEAVITADLQNEIELLRFKGEVMSQMTKDLKDEFFTCLGEFEKECVKEKLLKLGEEIDKREKEGNYAVVTSLLSDFKSLSEKLKSLSVN